MMASMPVLSQAPETLYRMIEPLFGNAARRLKVR
jgi:hypothetical protein